MKADVQALGPLLVLALLAIGGGWFVSRAGGTLDEAAGPLDLAPTIAAGDAFAPAEAVTDLDVDRAALGRQLFFDVRLSRDGSVSCASCHDLHGGGADHVAHSVGVGGAMGPLNTPSVFNRVFDPFLFWDGRARDLEHQVGFPLTDPGEMGSTWSGAVGRLTGDAAFAAAFQSVYSRPTDEAGIRNAIAEFERSLVTLDAPFDRYLRGEQGAMSDAALRGYERFTAYGCSACHQGRNLGGNMFQVFGIYGDYFADRGAPTRGDLGRFNVTGDPRDRHVFKVPSLRNVAQTAPYLHDGTAETLGDVIAVMARYQLGRSLPEGDVSDLVAFLEALTGTLPPEVAL
jgi:cytochrome c peroxidase